MVTKSPKTRVLGKRRFKNILVNPTVHVRKLDENVVQAYQRRLTGLSCSPSTIKKEERTCLFNTQVDLNENEHVLYSAEIKGPCQCSYCSPYREMKSQTYQEYLDEVENQENFVNRNPYLGNIIQESAEPYPYSCSLVQENTQVPSAVKKCDTGTQTAPRQYRFTCKDCLSQFNNEYYYDRHVEVHRKLYECAFCSASFPNERQLQPHILMHMSTNYFECAYCNCLFSNKKHLIKHITSHDKKFFECAECSAKFLTDKGLQNHKQSHVSSGKMIHIFRLAKGKSVKQPVEIRETESANVDLPEEPQQRKASRFFVCNLCQLSFPAEHNLAMHNVIHNRKATVFLHCCSVCGARFRLNAHLLIHLRFAHKK